METPQEYLIRTKSAVEHLMTGIDAYLQIFKSVRPPVLVGTYSNEAERGAALEQWVKEKAEDIEKVLVMERTFLSEKYALSVLCGSLLQIAAMAIRLYSKNEQIPVDLLGVVKAANAPYCIGRRVREAPLGLVIYAGRNQYNHVDENKLSDLNSTVFEWLATKHGCGINIRDPAFDLKASLSWSYPSNITSLIGWRDYKTYENDMRSLLGV